MNPKNGVFKLLLLILFFRFSSSIDTITTNQSIKDGDPLVSSGETFALGFFSPGNSSLRYVGIWYNKILEQTVVWVANRDNPINGTSGFLSLNQEGNLVIYENSQNFAVWQTNVSVAEMARNISYSAQILDSGNLVLFQGDTGSSDVVWQSFDHPTNTQLPKMKIGLDRRTGLDRFLTSWKSIDNPSTGEYSSRMDPSGCPQVVLLRNGSDRLWRTGPWVGGKWRGIPEMGGSNFPINSSYVDDDDEVSVKFVPANTSILSKMILDELGFLRRAIWLEDNGGRWFEFFSAPKDRCDQYGHCGPYGNCNPNSDEFECMCLPGYEPGLVHDWNLRDGSAGCLRKRGGLPMCGNGEGFVKVANAKIPDTSGVTRLEMNSSREACEKECLRNCSCLAYTSGGRGECVTWYGNLTDTKEFSSGGLDLYVRVDAMELAQQSKNPSIFQSKNPSSFRGKKLAVLVTAVVVISLLIISLLCWLVIKRGREAGQHIQASDEENLELPVFGMATAELATNKFSDANKIGEGGFGPVYKGQLSTGQEIAVKRLSANSKQGLNEFKNEVILIAKLQHRNLVRLLGYCVHGEERLLIYEYMSNGSLDSFIFGSDNARSKSLTWRRRLDIIVGIARGLHYLHQDSRLRVIHRDLKASNVLLDCEMNPKISDFGLARAFGGDESSAITRRVVGTYGYMSPEYVIDGLFSMKSDVFSFGVIILEVLSGKRNRLFHHQDHEFNLLGHAWKLWTEGKATELLDSPVEGSIPMSEVLRCLHVGLLCVQKSSEDRPNMSSVLLMLITETTKLPQPKQPGFYTERSSKETNKQPIETSSSLNEMTMTQLEAR